MYRTLMKKQQLIDDLRDATLISKALSLPMWKQRQLFQFAENLNDGNEVMSISNTGFSYYHHQLKQIHKYVFMEGCTFPRMEIQG